MFQPANQRPGGFHCHFLESHCNGVRFTSYPAPNDNFWPLKIKRKGQEPDRLRIKLIFKIRNLSVYSLLLYMVLVIFKIRFSFGHFILKMMKFPVPCNCISFDFLLLWLAYHWHFSPGMLKVYIIRLKGKNTVLIKMEKTEKVEIPLFWFQIRQSLHSLILHTCQGWCHGTKPVLSYLKWKKKKQFNNLLDWEKNFLQPDNPKMTWRHLLCNFLVRGWRVGRHSGKDLRRRISVQGMLWEIQEVLEGPQRNNMVTLSTIGIYNPRKRDEKSPYDSFGWCINISLKVTTNECYLWVISRIHPGKVSVSFSQNHLRVIEIRLSFHLNCSPKSLLHGVLSRNG